MAEENDATPSTDDTDDRDSGEVRLTQGRQFHYGNGVAEAVVAVEGDRVLTVREYPTREGFRAMADRAVSVDVNEELAAIDAEAILSGADAVGPSASAGAAASGTEFVAPAGTKAPEDTEDGEDDVDRRDE